MNLCELKLFSAFLIIAATLLGTVLANRSAAHGQRGNLFALGNTFAAGVFLGAALIHMLPDASDEFAAAVHTEFPLAGFFASVGFLLILGIEKGVLKGTEAFAADETDRNLYPYILVIVLSIHAFIAGVALGTESRLGQILIILVAVLAHKSSAAFALTVSMITAQIDPNRRRRLIWLFTFMTPAGIAAGIVIALPFDSTSSRLLIALFDALVAGTFLYIAIMEIMNRSFSDHCSTGLKLLSALCGVLLMALLAVWL